MKALLILILAAVALADEHPLACMQPDGTVKACPAATVDDTGRLWAVGGIGWGAEGTVGRISFINKAGRTVTITIPDDADGYTITLPRALPTGAGVLVIDSTGASSWVSWPIYVVVPPGTNVGHQVRPARP